VGYTEYCLATLRSDASAQRALYLEGWITRGYRFTFQIRRDAYLLRRVGPREEALRQP
jgi:hypothetical protein